MENKNVKIIGLSVNSQLGILRAVNLQFDENNNFIAIKGEVGAGKSTLQTALKLGTNGSDTLKDKQLYGNVDIELELLDQEHRIFVGCKSDKKGKLTFVIYKRDNDGNLIENPVIDGVKATPAKYLDSLHTALTWNVDQLTNENPTVQKKILLEMFQSELRKIGVIFDKSNPDYKGSILYKIDVAEKYRNELDAIRKTKGGIADDLKELGYNVDRPDTLPNYINLDQLNSEFEAVKKDKIIAESSVTSIKEKNIAEIKLSVNEIKTRLKDYNTLLNDDYNKKLVAYQQEFLEIQSKKTDKASLTLDVVDFFEKNKIDTTIIKQQFDLIQFEQKLTEPIEPLLVIFDKNDSVVSTSDDRFSKEINADLKLIIDLRLKYNLIINDNEKIDTSEFDLKLDALNKKIYNAKEINKICEAIESFFNWQEKNNEVLSFKNEYVQLLAKVDTGVLGLKIVPNKDGDEIYLMYDGCYDPKYFNNPNCELRKVSSYSGTQKPVICLLIQKAMLAKKPKAMRQMFIDNVPIDKKTRILLESMCNELDIRVFVNMTGDYTANSLSNGEILIEGGEVFFNDTFNI